MILYTEYRLYNSTLGKLCLVLDRPLLTKVELDDDNKPERVYSHNPTYVNGVWFNTLKGLTRADYNRTKPDNIIYRLGDGTLLMATAEVCNRADTSTHSTKSGACLEHQVSDLQLLAELPPSIYADVPVYSFC